MRSEPLLGLRGLSVSAGRTRVLEGVTLDVQAGEMVGLVGESGSGKSVTALSVMRLLATPPMRIVSGSIRFEGQDLTSMGEAGLRKLRGDSVAMIFQEPMSSLNPVFTVGWQIQEMIRLHRRVDKRRAEEQAEALLARVGVPAPAAALRKYPHQMSGGQRQRVMIAIALACEPKLLIADEPTTALDATVQAQILELIDQLRREEGMAVLLITHDLGVVSQHCDRVAVMYLGRIVECAAVDDLFAHPRHRYTEALMRTIPANNPPGRPLPAISGTVPRLADRPTGCAFHPRCPTADERCARDAPPLTGDAHPFACWRPASSPFSSSPVAAP